MKTKQKEVLEEDKKAWAEFIRAALRIQEVLHGEHSLHGLIMNDIDHRAHDVREALDDSVYFWRFDLKKKRPGAIVLDAPN